MSTAGVAEYQAQIASLEAAIEVAKSDLHKQILSYQELLDVKLALDAEITTYRTLLDGEDIRSEMKARGKHVPVPAILVISSSENVYS